MQIVGLKDIDRKDTPLHYIREFHGVAVLESNGSLRELPLAFTVERKPIGQPEVSVRFLNEPDWPLIPLMRTVKDFVIELDKTGGLP
jgi:hypothetical protein